MPAWSKPFAKAAAWNHTFKNIQYLVTYILFLKKPGVLENLLSLYRKYTPGCTGSRAGSPQSSRLSCLWIQIFPFVPTPRIDEDHDRFPRLIADAECRHSRCVNPEGQLDHSLNSVPIRQAILVLRREQKGCQQSYRLEKKIITVGCTCVTPLIQHQAWREPEVQEQLRRVCLHGNERAWSSLQKAESSHKN